MARPSAIFTVNGLHYKVCGHCKAVKLLDDFYKRKRGGPDSWCKSCRGKVPTQTLAEKRNRSLIRKYGITAEQYDVLHVAQNGLCAVCGLPEQGKHLSVDHDHHTGIIRALLCQKCNTALGLVQDNPEILRKMLQYLAGHTER